MINNRTLFGASSTIGNRLEIEELFRTSIFTLSMTRSAYIQLIDAANDGDGFAMTLMGVYLINYGNSETNVASGIEMIHYAAMTKNVLWAKSLWLYMKGFSTWSIPIENYALVDDDAVSQFEMYCGRANIWAMAILGYLLIQRKVITMDKERAILLLTRSAQLGSIWAKELLNEYGHLV